MCVHTHRLNLSKCFTHQQPLCDVCEKCKMPHDRRCVVGHRLLFRPSGCLPSFPNTEPIAINLTCGKIRTLNPDLFYSPISPSVITSLISLQEGRANRQVVRSKHEHICMQQGAGSQCWFFRSARLSGSPFVFLSQCENKQTHLMNNQRHPLYPPCACLNSFNSLLSNTDGIHS